MVDLDAALAFACQLAEDGGRIARQHHNVDIAFDPKADSSPVTAADIEINALVISRCRAAYPDVGVLGEEESSQGSSSLLWVCDPIDGTIPYMLGMQASTFCLALVQDGRPIVGVVYDFLNKRMYSAIAGKGAQLNGKPIQQSKAKPLKMVNLETYPSAPHNVGNLRERLISSNWQAPNFATAAYMSMAVVTGRIAAVVYTGSKAWDIAAAKVVVEECGGLVTDLDGQEQRYDSTITGAIVTSPAYAQELRRFVAESRGT